MGSASAFLQSRIDYLTSLPRLGCGWIGGGGTIEGESPAEAVCAKGVEFLNAFESIEPLTAANLVMGPLVKGGLLIEWKPLSQGRHFFLTLPNTGMAEFEIVSPIDAEEHEAELSNALEEFLGFAELSPKVPS